VIVVAPDVPLIAASNGLSNVLHFVWAAQPHERSPLWTQQSLTKPSPFERAAALRAEATSHASRVVRQVVALYRAANMTYWVRARPGAKGLGFVPTA
jgi:hypothetical protein